MQTIYTPYNFTVSDISSGPPTSPSTGDIWVAVNVDTNGTRWQFQYNAGSASAYKWEFIGGADAVVYANASVSVTLTNTWQAKGASFTIPRAGDYDVSASGEFNLFSTAGIREVGLGQAAVVATIGWSGFPGATTAGYWDTFSGSTRMTGCTTAAVNTYFWAPATQDAIAGIELRVRPVRVS